MYIFQQDAVTAKVFHRKRYALYGMLQCYKIQPHVHSLIAT